VTEDPEHLRLGPLEVRLERVVYATVVLMSVLAVYDGWAELTSFLGVAIVIVAPLVALAVAHLFSEVIEEIYHRQRPLTGAEWRRLSLGQLRILVAAVPPLVMLGIGWLSPLDERRTIAVVLWTGVVTLVVLSLVAARRAGIRGWRLAVAGVGGGVIGLIVISLQVLLKPH
jgi:hypothetical protein